MSSFLSIFFHFGVIPENAETGQYDYWLVFLSFIAIFLGSFTSLLMAGSLIGKKWDETKRWTHIGAAVALGGGVWSMHFIGMLAYEMKMQMSYDISMTVISMLIAVGLSYHILNILNVSRITPLRIIVSSILLGIAICAMHYTGMASMQMDATLRYMPLYFALSVVIAIVTSGAGLGIVYFLTTHGNNRLFLQLCASLIVSIAVCSMHYTGMASAVFIPFADCRYAQYQYHHELVVAIVGVMVLICAMGMWHVIKTSQQQIKCDNAQGRLKENGYARNLSTQIFIVFLVCCAGLGISLALIQKNIVTQVLKEKQVEIYEIASEKIIQHIETRLSMAEIIASSIANLSKVLPKEPELFKTRLPYVIDKKGLEDLVAGGGYWPEPHAFDPKVERYSFFWARNAQGGLDFLNDYNDPKGNGYHHEEWYVPARFVSEKSCYWSKSYVDPYSGQPMVTCSIPVFIDGKFTGVSTVDLKLEGLENLIDEAVKSIGGYGFIVDRHNKFITYPDVPVVTQAAGADGTVSKEKIYANELVQRKPKFSALAAILENMNEAIMKESGVDYGGNKINLNVGEIEEFLTKNSPQISVQEAKVIAAMLFEQDTKDFKNHNYAKPVKQDIGVDHILGEPVYVHIVLMPDTFWKIALVMPKSYITKKADEVFYQLLHYTASIILVAFLLFFGFLHARLLKPIGNIITAIKENTDNKQVLLDDTRNDELGEVAYWYNLRTREMLEAKDAAETASRVKSDFLANMSHEIRTPMNAVLGLSNLLLDTKLLEEQAQYVRGIRTAGEGLLNIINDIIDISKIEAGKLIIEKIDFDFFDMLQEVVNLYSFQAREKGLEVLVNVDEGIPRYLKGDPTRLKQVFANLISNAIKFTAQGHIYISITLAQRKDEDVELLCKIEDTGIGISPENQKKVFQKFTQAEESTTRKFGGTGLGLAIVSELIELMGGGVTLESEVGKGSIFIFNIVLEKAQRAPEEYEYANLNTLRVLVIDDYQLTRDLLTIMLARAGVQASQAISAEEGFDLLAAGDYDVCLVDYSLAGMNGLDFVHEVRSHKKYEKLALIMVSGVVENISYSDLKNQGLDGFIKKPFLQYQILNAIRITVQNRREKKDAPLVTRHNLTKIIDGREEQVSIEKYPQYTQSTVLVVEDMKMNLLIIKKVLEKFGCNIDAAVNGLEAVKKVKEKVYDLILMDCQMPEMDGFTATRVIRDFEKSQDRKSVPIVALTADAMTGDREKCLASGMDDYINKPFKEDDIARALEKWII